MRLGWKRISAALFALAGGGLLLAWSGLLDVRASTGHWRVTDWFLHWVMRSSVRTSSLGIDPPAFTPGMLSLAAGHYEIGCAGCHGSPAMLRPAATAGMLPPPPDLKDVAGHWSDAELFEIVRHGVRYTGMPAWPAPEREDEVWAMVAFLRQYSHMDGAAYRRLAGFSASQSSEFGRLVETCSGCHSAERTDEQSLIPRLDGQSELYLRKSMEAYISGERPSGVMAAALSPLSEDERGQLAEYFARRKTGNPARSSTQMGKPAGNASSVASCLACHDSANVNEAYPRLAGQPVAYLQKQLHLFRAGLRGGSEYAHIMTRIASRLSDDDIHALADYYGAPPMN